ncbi:MAG: hypothetical protein ACOC0P_07790, partial [Planctomycetota bacterium]
MMNTRTIGLVFGSLVVGLVALLAIIRLGQPTPAPSPASSASPDSAVERQTGVGGETDIDRADSTGRRGSGQRGDAPTDDELARARDLVSRSPGVGAGGASGGRGEAAPLDLRSGPGTLPPGMRVPMVEVQRLNEEGRLGQWYRAADSEPLEGGWVRLTQPAAWLYLSETRMLVVEANRAHVFWPSESRPERGRLDQGVRIRLFELDEQANGDIYDLDPEKVEALVEVVTDQIEFETSPYQV